MSASRVVVIGAGASGLMAAGRAAELGARVRLLEKMPAAGSKIAISGQGRCNVTNSRDLDDFIPMYGDNGRFLYGVFRHFFRDELLALFNKYGLQTVTERGGRIFPASGQATDVTAALLRYVNGSGAEIKTGCSASAIMTKFGRVCGVVTAAGPVAADAVVLAVGGASFPKTGSTGDGYAMARALGHSIVKIRPALVPLVVTEVELARSMQGVSLENVRLTSFAGPADSIPGDIKPTDWGRGISGRRPPAPVIESLQGDMIFTHFGIGGPLTLTLSLAVIDAMTQGPVSVAIDLKPALSTEKLRARLQRDFDQFGRRGFRHLLAGLLPHSMVEPFVGLTGIDGDRTGSQITGAERDRLLGLLKSLRFNIVRPLPLSSAIVTAGGVALDEIDPRTMESRLVKGLFFGGEVIDIDGTSGGYNLQAAFSTGYVAGESAANPESI